uniref:Uncharacterized protein n=1 Tax=Peronospora matthiolae TaxID=2874970 RepID=A0AAV1UYY5_9STRA
MHRHAVDSLFLAALVGITGYYYYYLRCLGGHWRSLRWTKSLMTPRPTAQLCGVEFLESGSCDIAIHPFGCKDLAPIMGTYRTVHLTLRCFTAAVSTHKSSIQSLLDSL